ncbi:MAG TPA: hypothetical protein VL096_15880 [Pirellulaceae bacterium]|nr:hypothetical protein [Pirellulaceae bacterium]
MTSSTHIAMHADHRFWEREISLWRDDLRAWQSELAKAQGEIKQLEKALEDHSQALLHHASKLRMHEQNFAGHEHALAQYEQGGDGQELLPMVHQHDEETTRQNESRSAHEQLKRRHHAVIAHWTLILKALREPIVVPEAKPSSILT